MENNLIDDAIRKYHKELKEIAMQRLSLLQKEFQAFKDLTDALGDDDNFLSHPKCPYIDFYNENL